MPYQEAMRKLHPVAKYKSLKKRQKISLALLSSNLLILLIIVIFIVMVPKTTTIKTTSTFSLGTNNSSLVSNPLDQLSSANIALTVSEVSNLPEQTPIRNQAESQQADLSQASTAGNVISEPQVVQTALKSRADIFTYTTVSGDSVATLADKFGITSNSILWSNNLSGNNLTAGQKLIIPPVSGIVYTVKAGDTTAGLAQKYNATEAQIIAYNDAEIHGITAGEQIIIPGASVQSAYTAPSWSGPAYGYNGYDYGFCTWYVASKISVPTNWGNASSWGYYAALSGWKVSSHPSVGAIAQRLGGQGHVAIVESVNPDGTIWVSEMNSSGQKSETDSSAAGGWGRVDWKVVSPSLYNSFITN